eukprot:5762192-Alexandrium_andersonii.AAC.1
MHHDRLTDLPNAVLQICAWQLVRMHGSPSSTAAPMLVELPKCDLQAECRARLVAAVSGCRITPATAAEGEA